LTAASSAIGQSLLVTENCICKFGRDTVCKVGKKIVKAQVTAKSNFSNTVFQEQSFYFPDKSATHLGTFTPGGDSLTISGSLFERWTVSDDCPNHFVNTSDLHDFVPVGKSLTYISSKFELARSPPSANPLTNMTYYKPQNIDYLFQRSQVVSVSKWNALLGKESTNPMENHADTNSKDGKSLDDDDGTNMVNDAGMTESTRVGLQSRNDCSYVDSVLEQTLGEIQHLVVAEEHRDSTVYPEDHALNL
jgi:hypothetical protein